MGDNVRSGLNDTLDTLGSDDWIQGGAGRGNIISVEFMLVWVAVIAVRNLVFET